MLGPHINKRAGEFVGLIERWQPVLATVLDPDPNALRSLRAASPATKWLARIYVEDSEMAYRIANDPTGTAQWAHEKILTHPAYGLADWYIVENEVCQVKWEEYLQLCRYTERAALLAGQAGYRRGLCGFSVGQPDMPENDRMGYWRAMYPTFRLAVKYGHIIVAHQYGAPNMAGPARKGGAPWMAHRIEEQILPRLPSEFATLRFIISEFGIDGGAQDEHGHGWKSYTTAQDYVTQLKAEHFYALKYKERIIGRTIYQIGNDSDWKDYNSEGEVVNALADFYASLRAQPPIVVQPPTPAPAPDLHLSLTAALDGKLRDKRGKLPRHATVRFPTRASDTITTLVIHHTAGAATATAESIATYHVNSRQYETIAYHFLVYADGTVDWCNDLALATWHCGTANRPGDENAYTVGIAFNGTFTKPEAQPTAAAITSARRLCDALKVFLGRALVEVGHRDLNPTTLCPGDGAHTAFFKAASATPKEPAMTPKVIDLDGSVKDLAWLKANYGAEVALAPIAVKRIALKEIRIQTGPSVCTVEVRDEQGQPLPNYQVGFYWPRAADYSPNRPDQQHDLTGEAATKAYKTLPVPYAAVQLTAAPNGDTGFGIGMGSYIYNRATGGPHTVWVLSNLMPSDVIAKVGMLAGTEHTGPLKLVFQIISPETTPTQPLPDPLPPITGKPTADQVRHRIYNAMGVAYNPDAALVKRARELDLGAPQTNETDLGDYIAQGFMGGILLVRKGDWANIELLRY